MAATMRGKIIGGKYRVLSPLGYGAMGEVYLAEQLDAEKYPLREVALKVIQSRFSRDPDFSRRFLREVRVATRLSGPHSVAVYDSGWDDEVQLYFFTMELIRGPTLKEVLEHHKQGLAVERVANIVGQICDALDEAHSQEEPIVHRDLKPANIFVKERQGRDWVKVGDFGIAKVLGEHTSGLTHTGASPGTPRYMAPEQWMGKEVDGRTDLYALGVMMYELLTGHPPFSGDQLALMYQHLNDLPPPLPSSIPSGIRHLVDRLLAKAPQDRPEDALSVKQALEKALLADLWDAGATASTVILEQKDAVSPQEEEGSEAKISQSVDVKPEVASLHQNAESISSQEAKSDPRLAVESKQKAEAEGQPQEVGVRRQVEELSRSPVKQFLPRVIGVVGGVVVLVVLIGGLWYHSQQQEEPAKKVTETRGKAREEQGRQNAAEQLTEGEPQRTVEGKKRREGEEGQRGEEGGKGRKVEQTAREQGRAEEGLTPQADLQLTKQLARAREQVAEERLTTPPGDNAFETYQDILQHLPGQKDAVEGIRRIVEHYVEQAKAAKGRGESAQMRMYSEKALTVVEQSRTIAPQDEALLAALQEVSKKSTPDEAQAHN